MKLCPHLEITYHLDTDKFKFWKIIAGKGTYPTSLDHAISDRITCLLDFDASSGVKSVETKEFIDQKILQLITKKFKPMAKGHNFRGQMKKKCHLCSHT